MQNIKNYLISFVIGLIIFLIFGNFITGWLTSDTSKKNNSRESEKTHHSGAKPDSTDNTQEEAVSGKTFTAVIGGYDESGKELDALIFIKADETAKNYIISSIPTNYSIISKNTDPTTEETVDTKVRIKDYPSRYSNKNEMTRHVLDTVHAITGMDVDYYAFFDSEAVMKIFKEADNLKFTIPEDIVYIGTGTEEEPEFSFEAGSMKMTGEDAINYMRYAYNTGDELKDAKDRSARQVKFVREMLKQVLKNIAAENNPLEVLDALSDILSSCETNFTVDDFSNNYDLIAMFGEYTHDEITPITTEDTFDILNSQHRFNPTADKS